MSSYAMEQAATVQCQHAGSAQASASNTRVKLNGQPILTQSDTHTVSGCPYVTGTVYTPCVTASWTSAAQRVKAGGVPVLFKDSQATCAPNGTGVTIVATQMRVKAT